MAEFRKYVYALAVVALLAGLTIPASAQTSMVCTATSVPSNLRAEGMTELAGDVIIDCVGGTPTLAGSPVPQVNITISTSVSETSKITLSSAPVITGTPPTNFSEAIIIVDQPNTITWSNSAATYGGPRNVLNCGSPGAPDSNPATGFGICQILAPGSPWATYDGTPNGQPGGTTCVAVTQTIGSYGCGRPNVFQGRQDLLSPIGPQQRIVFLDVPVDPPGFAGPGVPGTTIPPNCDAGGACHRFFRITNIRVNAATLGGGSGGTVSGVPVFADITVSNEDVMPLVNTGTSNTLTIGRVNTTIAPATGTPGTLTLIGCKDNNTPTGSVTFQELIADAWKPRNISLLLNNNTGGAAGTFYNLLAGIGTNSTPATWVGYDCRQNVPGTNYETEAGFQNTAVGGTVCPAGIPAPNPPTGLGSAVAPPTPNSAFDDGAAGAHTNIQVAGIATSGTRIQVNIQNILGTPGTVDVRIPGQVLLRNRANNNPSGVAILQSYAGSCSPDAAGDNAFCPANAGFPTSTFADGTVSVGQFANNQAGTGLCTTSAGVAIPGSACSAARAFYEIVFADPGVQEIMTVPFFVDYKAAVISLQPPVTPSPITIATGLGYAPEYSNSAPQSLATTAALPPTGGGWPYPRFIPGIGNPIQLFSISGKCVCDLLFPYVTDATILPGSAFDTGIAIANTSRDPGSVQRALGAPTATLGTFGFASAAVAAGEGRGGSPVFGQVVTNEQTGPIQFWYYSTQQGAGSPNFGNLGNGAQGNTQCTNVATPGQCNDLNGLLTLNTGTNVPAGGVFTTSVKNGSTTWGLLGVDGFVGAPEHSFTGYIIAQASFQYCHGTAFVSTNGLAAITGLTIPSLSYQALELDNPGLDYRTTVSGEALTH